MFCPNCNEPYEKDTVFCGKCGKQVAPLNARGATVAEPTILSNPGGFNPNSANGNVIPRGPFMQTPSSPPPLPSVPSAYTPPADLSNRAGIPPAGPAAGSLPPDHRNHRARNIFIVLVLLLVVGGASAGLIAFARNNGSNNNTTTITATASNGNTKAAPATINALAFFSDSQNGQGHSSALKLTTSGLAAPPSGLQYYAWMVDKNAEKIVQLGALKAQGQNFSLNFAGKTNLVGAGNTLEITQEQGTPSVPVGTVVLSATYPPLAFVHIRHLLFSFDTTPGKVGLLVGLRDQARALNGQATLLKSLSGKDQRSVSCAAQSIVNLIEGNHGQNTQPLNSTCSFFNVNDVGDGFALLDPGNPTGGYVPLAAAHASLAATQSDTTDTIRLHAGHVQIATDNLKKWLPTIDNDALKLVNNPGNSGLIQEIVTLSDHVLNGVDLDNDEQVDPVPGEAGAVTAYTHGQLMAQLVLKPGA
jgi:hypothetical protein